MVEGRIKKIKKARFALPSLVTLGSVFCAFLSMSFVFKSQALQGDERLLLLQYAAIAIIGSIVFDTFDGKVARWTKTSTKFGMELDSLSDCVSFGIAPALLIYGFALNEAGIFGLIASFIYACGALLRLARFNIEAPDEGVQTFFKGIPSPAGAACLAAIVLACIDTQIMPSTPFELNTLCVVAIAVGLLMVSNVKYAQRQKDKRRYRFRPHRAHLVRIDVLRLYAIYRLLLARLLLRRLWHVAHDLPQSQTRSTTTTRLARIEHF